MGRGFITMKFKGFFLSSFLFGKSGFLSFAFIICSTVVYSQVDKILARAGDIVISETEFINRWELSPQVGREQSGPMTDSRKKLLYTLVSEKLLALHALENGLDTAWVFKRQMKSMEEILIRDQLFKAEIESKVKITPQMLLEARKRAESFVRVSFLHSVSADSLSALRVLAMAGTPFDSLLARRPEKAEQPEYLEVTYGMMEKDVENVIYNLTKGEISKPVKRENGFFIFLCREIGDYPPKTNEALKVFEKKLKDMVHIREADRYYIEFMKSFFVGKNLKTDGKLYQSLQSKLTTRIGYLFSKLETPKIDKPIGLPASEYQLIENEFGPDSLKMIFIKYGPYPVTLRDFLYDLQFRGFGVTSGKPAKIKSAFYSTVELMVRDAALNAEGYKRGYQLLPEVIQSLEIHKLSTLSEKVKGRVFSNVAVTDEEIRTEYQTKWLKSADSIVMNLNEIQVESMMTGQQILLDYQAGSSFLALADQFNENVVLRSQKHETGFFVASQRPSVGNELVLLEPGEVYGPVQRGSVVSLFKMIEKKKINAPKNKTEKPIDQVWTEVKAEIYERKYLKNLSTLTVQSAQKWGLEMNEDALNSLPLTSVNMVGFQEMGFGGKIMAVPYTSEFTEWVKDWKKLNLATP